METENSWRLVQLPTIRHPLGDLTFVEGGRLVPFEIKRVYYVYGVPSGTPRSGHAHRAMDQVLIPIGGGFNVELDDGTCKRTMRLEQPQFGLYIRSLVWRQVAEFSPGAICLALASTYYDEADYIRDYADFIDLVKGDA